MIYTYNKETKSFGIYSNFIPKSLPKGYVEITEEEYEALTAPKDKESVEEKD